MGKDRKKNWGGRREGAGRKAEMKDSIHLAVHIPGAALRGLKREAKKQNLPLSVYVREILKAARSDLRWG